MPEFFIQVRFSFDDANVMMKFNHDLDLKSDNLMLSITDDSLLQEFEKAELDNPSPRKVVDET